MHLFYDTEYKVFYIGFTYVRVLTESAVTDQHTFKLIHP